VGRDDVRGSDGKIYQFDLGVQLLTRKLENAPIGDSLRRHCRMFGIAL
jgi:hypothetical protein